MLRKFYFVSAMVVISMSSFAQKNPKIDKANVVSLAADENKAAKEYSNAEKYYRMGEGTYDEALKYYLRLYEYCNNDKALNYKIGACYLGASNKKAALTYLLQSEPSVAKDYYYLLGRAYQYNYKYTEARESFEKYFELQNHWNRKAKLARLVQQKKECNFGQTALKDSVPVFITNMGPVLNTYYDDYGAFFLEKDSTFYYTSRRPHREPSRRVSRYKFNEKILYSEGSWENDPEEANLLRKLKRSKNVALAGYNEKDERLYFYKGKKNSGDIYSAKIKNGKAKKQKNLKGRMNHIAYKETELTVAENGDGYFVSTRRGGEGGKDIWYCKRKSKKRFSRIKNLGDLINTPFDEECVYITPDGNTLYFSSNGHDGMGGFDVFKSVKTEGGRWSKPVNLGYPINSPADELFYRKTNDPDVALYAAVRADGYGGLDIYKIVNDNRIPFYLSGVVTDNKTNEYLSGIVNVFNAEDDKLIVSSTTDSLTNLYSMSFEDAGSYYLVVNADGYQSVRDSIICPSSRNDSIAMSFALEKLKFPFTISGNVRDSATFYPISAVIKCYDADADTLLVQQVSNPTDGKFSMTLADKYNVRLEIFAEDYFTLNDQFNAKNLETDSHKQMYDMVSSKVYYNLDGSVKSADGEGIPNASLFYYRLGETSPFFASKSDSAGLYNSKLEEGGPFNIEIKAEGYFFFNDTVQFVESDSLHKSVDFELQKMKRGAKIVVENILFNSGKSTLVPSSYVELDKLADLLIENRDIRIEVSGHTDNVGSSAINKKLSKARALAVRNYLVTKGVEEERLEYEGYGFDQPIADNSTADGRAQNRRVEVKVLE